MTQQPALLIADDDSANLDSYAIAFRRQPYTLLTAHGGREALEILRNEPVDVVMTDLKMPEVDGLEVVRVAASLPTPPVSIVVTAHGTIESAVHAMQLGASDYITKPVNLTELRAKVEKAMELRSLRVRNEALQGLLNDRFKFEGVVGVSKVMKDVIEQARMVAATRASVLIGGESGTGKELIARAIHFNSPRASEPFVPINCAALPESLLESELFGHEKGSFTGAHQRRIGQFESAEGGTVFLDEIGEIPLATQVKLLRVLEQREITRVGSTEPIPIDIRLVAATNKDLQEEVKEGRFREDLFYRLNVVRIHLPALRERPEDVPALMRHFLANIGREHGRDELQLSTEAIRALQRYNWPGNIRELRNTVEQLIVFATSETVQLDDLPAHIRRVTEEGGEAASISARQAVGDEDMTLADLEKIHILRILEKLDGNRTQAAQHLGISRRTLQRKLKELGVADA